MGRHAASVSPLASATARPRHGTAGLRPRRPAYDRLPDVDGRVLRVRGSRHDRRARRQARARRAAALLRLDGRHRDASTRSDRHPRARIERYLAYERYLLEDVVPFVQAAQRLARRSASPAAASARITRSRWRCGIPTCSRRASRWAARSTIARFLDGYHDHDAYLLCPPHFLPGLHDDWFLDRYRRNKWVLVTGEHDICRGDTEQAAALLGAQGHPAQPARLGPRLASTTGRSGGRWRRFIP